MRKVTAEREGLVDEEVTAGRDGWWVHEEGAAGWEGC